MNEKENGATAVENIEELKAKIATLESEKESVVGELQEDRKKRQELKDQIANLESLLEAATKANAKATDPNDVSSIAKAAVAEELSKRDASVAQANKKAAIEKFVSEHKEFHQENDPTGQKREALNGAIARFNDTGLTSVEQFYSLVADAARLLGVNAAPQTSAEISNPYASTTKTAVTPKVATDGDISPKEAKLIDKNGWTKEKYLGMKAKNPEYMAKLLSYID